MGSAPSDLASSKISNSSSGLQTLTESGLQVNIDELS